MPHWACARGYIVVDDGSLDLSGQDEVRKLNLSAIEAVVQVALTRNYGNQRAVAIGTAYVASNVPCDYLVVMDSDHQDQPLYIPQLLETCVEADDVKIIFAERKKRSEAWSFIFMYRIYRGLYRVLTGDSMSIGNFSVVPGRLIRRLAHIEDIWNHFPAGVMGGPATLLTLE